MHWLAGPFRDGQIAAIAYVHNMVLITANPRDVKNFEGLRLEKWTRTGSPPSIE